VRGVVKPERGEATMARKLTFVTMIALILVGLIVPSAIGKVAADDREREVVNPIRPRPELPPEQPEHTTRHCDEGGGNGDEGTGNENGAAAQADDRCDNTDNNKNETENED